MIISEKMFFGNLKVVMELNENECIKVMGHSTSPPCGNLVDGLPHACHTKTIAKRARVEPRTPVVLTMKILISNMFASKKCLVITIIVLDNVLQLWI